ncbi:MAG: hypothetical protein AVDCRST_MAG88-4759, partial [uncultured Thermomicrobiales bacterium]
PTPVILAGIVLVAAVPRLAAPAILAPQPADWAAAIEREALGEARRMLTTGDFRPRTFARPSALLYAQTAAGAGTFLAGVSADRWRTVGAVDPDNLARGARLLNAIFGLAAVLLTYAVAARLYGRRAGLAAAALMALSPIAWTATATATEDALVALVGLAAFSLCAALDVGRGRGRGMEDGAPTSGSRGPLTAPPRSLTAALLVGAAAGVRPSLALLALPLVLAWWWERGAGRRVPGALLPAAAGTGFLLAMPFALVALPAVLDAASVAAREYDLRPAPATLRLATGLPRAAALALQSDPLLALAGALGACWALARHRRADLLVLAALVPTGLLLALHRDLEPRHFAPYGPFLALLGGAFLSEVGAALRGQPRPRCPTGPGRRTADRTAAARGNRSRREGDS